MMFQVNPLLGALFSSKDKSNKYKSVLCCNLLGTLRIKVAPYLVCQ